MAFWGGRFELRLANGGAPPSLLLVSLPPSPSFGGRGVGEFPVVVVVISSFLTCAWQFFFGQNILAKMIFVQLPFLVSQTFIYIYILLNVLGGLCENYFLLELIFMAFTAFSFWGGCLRVFWYACSNNRCLGASGKGARVDGRCTLCSLSCTCIPGIYIFGFSSVYGFHTLTGLGACVEQFCKKELLFALRSPSTFT
jgi:hypothetical protein